MLFIVIVLSACSKNKKNERIEYVAPVQTLPAQKTPAPPVPEEEPSLDLSGKTKNLLSGLYIDEQIAKRRPIAVVINNLEAALPQSGISQADIYYEVLAEADITRIIAVFQDFNSKKIGSIRSARDYFMDFALDHDAVFVHHGASYIAYDAIKAWKINNINGMYLDGGLKTNMTFWRDPVRYKVPKMQEHSSYSNAEKLLAQVKAYGYRENKADGHVGMFNFYEAATSPNINNSANKIIITYSKSNKPFFEYDKEKKVYNRFEYGKPQMDEENNTQLAVTNVLIQKVKMGYVKNDTEGRRIAELVSSGTGLLFTNGTYTAVTWKKESHQSPTQWFDEKGNKLTLNSGKTWICVVENDVTYE